MSLCSRCSKESPAGARFCAACGWELRRAYAALMITRGDVAKVLILALLIWGGGWSAQRYLAGNAPNEQFVGADRESPSGDAPGGVATGERGHQSTASLDPEIKALREQAENTPNDKEAWRKLVNALAERVAAGTKDTQVVFEAIGALRHILDIDPKDSEALLAMAEISFNQQAFNKAAEFYGKYLELNPRDSDIRSRYGSALTFSGDFKKALEELNAVLKEKPDHFQTRAYIAVTYAEMGRTAEALSAGEQALKIAPDNEARARFSSFLESVKNPKKQAPEPQNERGPMHAHAALPPEGEAIDSLIAGNQVAGTKYRGAEMIDAATLRLNFEDFPMDQMPPFVREKFTNSVKEKLIPGGAVERVVFYDIAAKRDLVEVKR